MTSSSAEDEAAGPTPASVAEWADTLTPAELLPLRHAHQAMGIRGPFALLDVLTLRPGAWVAVVADATGARYPVPLVADSGAVRRARPGDGAAQALLARLAAADSTGRAAGFSLTSWHCEPCSGERGIDVDQTNDSVVVGERAVVKWTVRSSSGPAPAATRIAALADAGFTGTPRPWGMLRHGEELVALVTQLVPGAVDGWEWMVDDVGRHARGELSLAQAVRPAGEMGTLAARMHQALPQHGHADRALAVEWARRADHELEQALATVTGPAGERLRALAGRVRAGLEPLSDAAGTRLLDVHGDLHVGQVLRWRPDGAHDWAYAVTDFDGNPVLPPEQRVEAQPAAVDVAGLVQSLDHVGRVVVARVGGADPGYVAHWRQTATTALLDSYRNQQGGGERLDDSLLRPFRLRQVIREYLYAVRHLPRWLYVPDAALPDLLNETE